jgi:hypothetical protein
MTTRTHLALQEEAIEEKGVQVRTTDPVSPALDQIWLNTTEGKVKYYDGTNVQLVGGGVAGATGVQGVPGATGVRGPTGVPGATGVLGQTGVQGQTGIPGVSNLGFFDNSTTLTNSTAGLNLVGLSFSSASQRFAKVEYYIYRANGATEVMSSGIVRLHFKALANSWSLFDTPTGDSTETAFSVTGGGQLQITSSNFSSLNWVSKTPLGAGRSHHGGFTIGTNGYVAGGIDNAVTLLGSVEKYDSTLNSWSSVNPLIQARSSMASFALGGFGFVAGGANAGSGVFSSTEKYNSGTNTWTNRAVLNTAAKEMTAFVVGSNAFVVGGADAALNYLTSNQKFDDSLNTWTNRLGLTTARKWSASFSISSLGYTAGGQDSTGALTSTERFNDSLNTWTTLPALLPSGRFGSTGFELSGYGYVTAGSPTMTDLQQFDPNFGLYRSRANLSIGRSFLSSNVIGSAAYAVGGFNGARLVANESLVVSGVYTGLIKYRYFTLPT